jgi:P-type E1-E2 ATPase
MLVDSTTTGDLPAPEVLRLAASLDQASHHVTANAIVRAARQQGMALATPSAVIDTPGRGVEGTVEGRPVIVGSRSFVAEKLGRPELRANARPAPLGTAVSAVAVDGRPVGELVLADSIRSEAKAMLDELHGLGIERVILASGDAPAVARAVGSQLGVDAAHGGLSPEDKVRLVIAEKRYGPVLMAGDGVNDAPALAAADIGIAMGVRGAAASTEVADAVLLVDRIDPIAGGIRVARRARRIALQSVVIGMGLSFLAMGVAMLGYLPPVQGALVQEAIDVIVILNALRVGMPQLVRRPAQSPPTPVPATAAGT